MNELFLSLGLASWKPLLAALLFPPLPFLVLVVAGARLMFRRRGLAWLLVLLGVAGVWLGSTSLVSGGLERWLLKPPPALTESQITELKRAPRTAIVVLGGGRRHDAPEYGVATLNSIGMERLRYGLWLSRQTGLPVAFSGGLAPGSEPGATEADIAARIAEREFGRPLRWTEAESRDTRENAIKTVSLLAPQGIERIVLVTHAYHMRRALRNFERALAAAGANMRITTAPMAVSGRFEMTLLDWLPSTAGFAQTRRVLHEYVGLLAGA
ncbi:MAG: YdcF family protein [Rubrivivax sp.]|nr:YdcF family protein [Rubrivivax sp.]